MGSRHARRHASVLSRSTKRLDIEKHSGVQSTGDEKGEPNSNGKLNCVQSMTTVGLVTPFASQGDACRLSRPACMVMWLCLLLFSDLRVSRKCTDRVTGP